MDKTQNSVRSLTNLYTVVIGVALSSAVVSLIDADRGLHSITLVSGLLFLSFIAGIIPFYHGALRHLDDAYIENDVPIKDGALMIDFLLLFFHGVAFVVLSLLFENPSHFAWVLMVVLSIDVIWGIFVHFGSSREGAEEWKWLIINMVVVLVAGMLLFIFDVTLQPVAEPAKLALIVLVLSLLRTLADYSWCWRFYFPKPGQ